MAKNRLVGVALLAAGILAGVAGAQAMQSIGRTRFVGSGLFSVSRAEGVNFHATLDDQRDGQPAKVLMTLIDAKGAIAARQEVTLAPGQSATLQHRGPGLYRALATFMSGDAPSSDRRALLTTVEIFGLEPTSSFTIPPTRFVCSSDDGGSNGRLPD